ncbi:LolA-like protein [Streptacidiphilus rugosus]|uniref:hypothetical protein n=1 Tax=Streptacidiphilus rugosus TaxID=405783 RepID=UPI00056241EB|nr:hypothetical protein [Streptacidiphilus rugosus]
MRHTRTLVAATTVALALGAVSACSAAKQAAEGAAAPLVSVADAMSLATTKTDGYSSVKVTAQISSGGSGQMSMSGRIGWKPFAMDVSVQSPKLAQLGSGTMREMFSGSTMYLNMGADAAAKMGGKHWMKMDLSTLGPSGKSFSDMINQSGGQDPATQLKLLTTSKGIKRVGTETVNGVKATHYQGTVNVSDLPANASGGLKNLLESAQKEGLTSETVDAWVGADNLPVRISTSAATNAGTFSSTVDYSDYSASSVTVTPPAASDTLDFGQLLKGLKS